jgi:PAS domain S-box-containing protein
VTAWENAGLASAERVRLAAAVDQAAEMIVMMDRAGKITYANPAFTRMTGFAAADAIGRDAQFLREGTANPGLLAEARATWERGQVWGGRLRYRRRDGSTVDVDLTVSPLRDGSGAVVGSIEVARDISRETALEAQLAEAQRMEAVGRLAGGIAHDFNNILTAISGFGQLASAQVASGSPVAEDIAEIRKASDRAAALTRALLAFSRRQVMQPSVLRLNEVVSDVSPMLARVIGEDVELVIRSAPELTCTLADRGQLEQVVMNLVVNARDAMPDGGRLTIETANVDLDAEYVRTHVGAAAGPHVMLAVSDTGVGMTTEVMEHAFEPFFTTKSHDKGTGLGLSTVIGIVQQSGGTIDVHSEPGLGTAFKIYLPRVEPQREPVPTAVPHSDSARGNETILVAEDERAVRHFVERVLTAAGYRVLTAANGEEALALARTLEHVDLLFTDMVMPGMRGPELAKELAAERPGLRTIYASGYTDDAMFRNQAAEGPPPYVAKPFTAEALLARVREVLDAPGSPPVRRRP